MPLFSSFSDFDKRDSFGGTKILTDFTVDKETIRGFFFIISMNCK